MRKIGSVRKSGQIPYNKIWLCALSVTSSSIRLNAYSAQAQNMCRTHIFKLLIMYAARNMCRTHIFKVVYKRRPHFLADDCSFPDCPVLWTPRFYYLSGFVDTALLPSVRFCGHCAFTICPVLWTPRFYHLSGFVDTALLPSVRFCGHYPYNAAQNSIILEFPTTQF